MATLTTPTLRANVRPGLRVPNTDHLGLLTFTFAFDSSYPTGGEACDLAAAAPNHIKSVTAVIVPSHLGYVFDWDSSAKKLLAYQQSAATSALTQVPNTTDLSTVTGVNIICLYESY